MPFFDVIFLSVICQDTVEELKSLNRELVPEAESIDGILKKKKK